MPGQGSGTGGGYYRTREKPKTQEQLTQEQIDARANELVAARDKDKYDNYEEHAAANPKQALADITQSLDERKRDFFWKVEDDLLNSIDDTSIVDTAKTNAAQGFGQQGARNDRMLSRYGMVASPSQQRESSRLAKLDESTAYASTVNNARLAQFDRNEGVKTQLLNNSRALTGQSIDGLSNAASLQTAREGDYANRKAAYKSQQASTLASLGGLALAFAI